MVDAQISAPIGVGVTLREGAFQTLKANFRGPLLRPGDLEYDQTRKVWNGMIDRRPALIARCLGAADVIAAVNFAREQELVVAVRGGGHNVAGSAVCDGGLMIDLSLMRGVQVDAKARTARVQGGTTWGDVDRETQIFGLATPGGQISVTGVAGLTLGGGYGYLRRKYGLSCDNLLSVDIVTADGQLVVASETENSDLFWAIRGGGGNFGIVTSFQFRLHPVGPLVYLCAPAYDLAQAKTVLQAWRDFMATAPEEISSHAVFWSMPDLPMIPPELHGKEFVLPVVVYAGAPEEGERITQPLRTLGPILLDMSGALPYTVLQSFSDAPVPNGNQYYWKSIHLDGLPNAAIDTLIDLAGQRPSPLSPLPIWHFGGAMNRIEPTATAFWHRRIPFMASFDAAWTDPATAEQNMAWVRDGCTAMRAFSSGGGAYVNFPGLGEDGEAQVRAAYGDNYERLVALKNKYDPTNLFRLNQNIRPTVRTVQGL